VEVEQEVNVTPESQVIALLNVNVEQEVGKDSLEKSSYRVEG